MHVASALKLAVASVYGYGLSTKPATSPVREALKRDGLYLAPETLAPAVLARLRAACEEIYTNHPEFVSVESNGSDLRIYGVDRVSREPVFQELQEKFRDEARNFYASNAIEQFVMAGNITYKEDGLGSGSGWHRDSPYRHQFKVIIYLSDAGSDEGPFEFVKGSHATASVVRSARFLGKPLSEDRFTNAEITRLTENGIINSPTTVVGPAGSILFADTRGLHRGRPLVAGNRRAVTFYIYHKTVPANVGTVLASIERR